MIVIIMISIQLIIVDMIVSFKTFHLITSFRIRDEK